MLPSKCSLPPSVYLYGLSQAPLAMHRRRFSFSAPPMSEEGESPRKTTWSLASYKCCVSIREKMGKGESMWKIKDGRYAFVAKVKMTANVVRNKTVSLWKSGRNGKVILCVAALLALWFVWPSGKGEAEAKREAEMTVEDVRHKIVDDLNGELASPSCLVRKRIEDAHGTVTVSHAYVLKCDVTTTDGSDKAKNISLVTVTIRFNWDGIIHKGGTTDLEVDLTADGKCTRSRIVRTDAMVNMEDATFWYNVGYGIGALLAL